MPIDDLETTETDPTEYVLPWYLRYARRLALLTGATVGIATGVAVISSSGCETGCNGICGHISGTGGAGGTAGILVNPDAAGFGGAGGVMGVIVVPSDAATDGNDAAHPDALVDAGPDDTGGGPRPAPVLPRAWIA
jgi:hypothetical protein